MNIFIVWLDRENARIFHINQEKMQRNSLKSHRNTHHKHSRGELQKQEEHTFHRELVGKLQEASHILLLGPGLSKHHFLNYVIEHHPALSKKIVGCETVDHPTDAQIAEHARKFFSVFPAASAFKI